MKIIQTDEKTLSKPHPFLAGIIDFYILAIAIGAAEAIIQSLLGKPVFRSTNFLVFSLVLTVILIVVIVFYYRTYAKKTLWLSPGEIISGRVVECNQKKEWINPYKVNRFGIYFIVLTTLIILGNEWDGVVLGQIYPFAIIAGKMIKIMFAFWGMVMLGKGRLKGALLIIPFFIFGAVFSSLIKSELGQFASTFYSILSLVYMMIFAFYLYKIRRSNQEELKQHV